MKHWKRTTVCAALLATTVWASSSSGARAETARDLFTLDLADPAVRAKLEAQGAQVVHEGPNGALCVKFVVPAAKEGEPAPRKLVALPFDIAPYRTTRLAVVADTRAQDVSLPAHKWTGIKSQLQVTSPTIGTNFIDRQNIYGTFDWQEISSIGIIADDAAQGSLNLGLQECSGTVWFSNIRVKVVARPPQRPAPTAPANLDMKATQYRGVMGPSKFNAGDFKDMAAWRVNVVRWDCSFYMMHGKEGDPEVYEAWFKDRLEDIQGALDAASANGIKLVIDIHQMPGGRVGDGTQAMFLDRKLEETFVANWERVARRFKDHPALWAYDLINEPVQNQASPEGVDDWFQSQARAAKAIRAIDPKTPIMFEVDGWDDSAPYALLQPIDVPNIIYEFHMYWPQQFTHQGVHTDQGLAKDQNSNVASITYPGVINGMKVDKEVLRARMKPVRDFQLAYNARIFMGEFSAVRWAPGAAQYLDDLMSIYEEYHWDWAYHAFRNWPGWSVEHANLPYDRDNHPKATEPTDRQLVLQKWLSLNPPNVVKAPAAP